MDDPAGGEDGGGEGGAVGPQGPGPHPSKEREDHGHQGGWVTLDRGPRNGAVIVIILV